MSSNSTDNVPTVIDINLSTPFEFGQPLYGYLLPSLVSVTTITNFFILIVLSQKHLRTPTNYILFSMALSDAMIGLTSFPWYFYYYTMGGYETDQQYGLNSFWCQVHPYSATIFPTLFKTCANWLTVFLAIQRYVYVCVPSSVHQYCTPRKTKIIIVSLLFASFVSVFPDIFGRYFYTEFENGHYKCYVHYSTWVLEYIGSQFYHIFSTSFKAICVHAIPCGLLMIFTWKLARTISKAENRKRSWATTTVLESNPSTTSEGQTIRQQHNSAPRPSTTTRIPYPMSASSSPNVISGFSRSSLYATNRMLLGVCIVFLTLEIPAAVIYVLHFLAATNMLSSSDEADAAAAYYPLNVALIIRNVLVIFISPIQFIIYCSMSEQFRLTVRQLFSSRLLFVTQAQATFHGGKRYSLILVDLDNIDENKRNGRGYCGKFRKANGVTNYIEDIPIGTLNDNSSIINSYQGNDFSQTNGISPNFFILILSIIPLLTIFGNLMVITAVYREKILHTVTNYLIVSLAISDFLVALCVMTTSIYFEIKLEAMNFGKILCNLYISFDVIVSTASILNLLAISLDRYIAISRPVDYCQYGSKGKRAFKSIAIVWVVSICVGLPILFGVNNLQDSGDVTCWLPFFTIHFTDAICMLSSKGTPCVHEMARFSTTWLGYLNSSLNPLIYTVFDQRFRRAFRNIIHCKP
uniref:G_PROTEIN_RECEP_F1_2 domain-containing protein n=1 Tax=Rhabditophanes sp. KR3021 TaxID=114890 RepID=A0AC35U7M2_9BILA